MLLISRRLATGLLLVPIGGIHFAGAARDATARITFVLVNDIYLMADELMSDGQRRGGFARLAAVVKAERAKASVTSGHVIFAHGGDTLSPSLMSGIDHGKHIMTLTNLIPPDIFVPGNHVTLRACGPVAIGRPRSETRRSLISVAIGVVIRSSATTFVFAP